MTTLIDRRSPHCSRVKLSIPEQLRESALYETRIPKAEKLRAMASAVDSAVEVLQELREYMDNRADAEFTGDPPRAQGNEEMYLLGRIDGALEKLGVST